MAKKKTVTTIEEGQTDGTEIELEAPDSDVPPSEADLIRQLLEIDSEDVRWNVKRISPADKAGFCTTYASSELSLERIREDWGAGRYQIRGFHPDGKYAGGRTVSIVEGTKKDQPHSNMTDIASILAATKKDDSGMLTFMMQAMKSQTDMMVALLTRPPPTPPLQPTLVEIVGALAPFLKPEKSSGDSVEVLLRGLELGKELGADRDTGMADIAMKGLEAVAPVLQNAAEESKMRMQARAQNPRMSVKVVEETGTAPAIEQSAQSEKVSQESNPMFKKLQWLGRQIDSLISLASKNKDPELYAEVFLDNLPDFITEDEIFERFNPEDSIDTLIKYKPEIANHKEWFSKFRLAVLAGFEGESEEGPTDLEGRLDQALNDGVGEGSVEDTL